MDTVTQTGKKRVTIRSAAKSDVGRKRSLNEDNFSVFPQHGVYVVADGMGGHAAGEVASRIAVETLEEFMATASQDDDITWPFDIDETLDTEANKLKTAIRLANKKIYETALQQQKMEGMGTTIVCLMVRDGRAYVAHVGDSRCYLIRNEEMRAVTSDHSWVNIQVLLGTISKEEAQHHPMKNIITRALGTTPDVEVDISVRDVRTGDRYVLCSDGLSGMITDEAILKTVTEYEGDLDGAAAKLIDLANANGGEDNVTVVLVECEVEGDGGIDARTPGGRESSQLEDTVSEVDLIDTLKNVPTIDVDARMEAEPVGPRTVEDISRTISLAEPIAGDEELEDSVDALVSPAARGGDAPASSSTGD